MSSYGWSIDQVDDLTVPQLLGILEQINKYPPPCVLLTETLKGMGGQKTDIDIDKKLGRIPYVEKSNDGKETGLRIVFPKDGKKPYKIIKLKDLKGKK